VTKKRTSLETLVIAVSIITLASIFTHVTAQENTKAADKSIAMKEFMAAENDKYVKIGSNLSEIIKSLSLNDKCNVDCS
jgi:hypothetical protein